MWKAHTPDGVIICIPLPGILSADLCSCCQAFPTDYVPVSVVRNDFVFLVVNIQHRLQSRYIFEPEVHLALAHKISHETKGGSRNVNLLNTYLYYK